VVHSSKEYPAPSYADLWALSQQLGVILEIAILSAIGFSENAVKAIVAGGKRADLIRNNVRV